jgi:hypothetical protein
VETMQFIKDNNIQTKDQYKFWAAGIYDGNKILPKIKKSLVFAT